MKHEHGKGQQMKPGQRVQLAFISERVRAEEI